MVTKRFILLFFILFLSFLLIFPGVAMAQDEAGSESNIIKNAFTIVVETPEQTEAGQTLTLTAHVSDNEYNEPVAGAKVIFFVTADFFIKDLLEIGEAVTDKSGTAMIDYIPNQPGVIQIVASYKAGSNYEPAVGEAMVNVTGTSKPLYQTMVGIPFPNSFLIWMISVVIILSAVWGTFMFVLYQVRGISRGMGVKGPSLVLIAGVAIIFIILVLVFVTPEPQYNFGFPP